MSSAPGGGLTAAIVFGARPWAEEVERYHPLSPPRARAQNARKVIEAGNQALYERAYKRLNGHYPG